MLHYGHEQTGSSAVLQLPRKQHGRTCLAVLYLRIQTGGDIVGFYGLVVFRNEWLEEFHRLQSHRFTRALMLLERCAITCDE